VKLVRTSAGWFVETGGGQFVLPPDSIDGLTSRDDLPEYLAGLTRDRSTSPSRISPDEPVLPPLQNQEVWAAGVTYFRSRTARMEESKSASGGDFYDRVYTAERPELFFKAAPWRVRGSGQTVRIRRDARWNVPEPELALVLSPGGRIVGYSAGNDMSSRDIEGENPLYLPQAKTYDGACAIGPAILVQAEPIPPSTRIRLEIHRAAQTVFSGATALSEMKRDLPSLVEFLFRETSFPDGCILLTGTGVVPPDDFTLAHGDEILITIDGIGTLRNIVE
jgi:2-dehydro-3-deoxy-D-arabinonate dehydratase